MRLFKKKVNHLQKRLETLEGYLGVVYVVDSDGWAECKRDADDQWNPFAKLDDRLKKVEEKTKGLK